MHRIDPLKCEEIEEDYHRSLFYQQAAEFLDKKDQEQDRNRVQENVIGSMYHPSPAPLSLPRKRKSQEDDYKGVEQKLMTLADQILIMHRNNDAPDTNKSLLKPCTGPNPAARNKRQC